MWQPGEKMEKNPDYKFFQACLNANELGNGQLFKYCHRGRFAYTLNGKDESWWYFNGIFWRRDYQGLAPSGVEEVVAQYLLLQQKFYRAKSEITDKEQDAKLTGLIKKIDHRVDSLRKVSGVKNTLLFAVRGEDGLTVKLEDFDRDPHLLGVANGVVDLRNGRLRPGKPEDMISKNTGVPYSESAKPPKIFLQTLNEMFPENPEMIDFLQIIFGSALSGYAPDKIFFLIGPGGSNGKSSCLMRPIVNALGDYAGPVAPEVVIDLGGRRNPGGPAAHLMSLRGLRLALVSELEERAVLATAQVKAHTGGDYIAARGLNQNDYVKFSPTHTLFVPSNHPPRMSGDDPALWRRLVSIPFTISFVDRPEKPHERPIDRERPAKIMKELPEILSWAVHGCLRWQAAGRKIELPALVKNFTANIRQDEDPVGSWLDDCCDEDPDGNLLFRAAYESFEGWFESNIGRSVPSRKWFGQHLALRAEKYRTGRGVLYRGFALKH